MVIQSRAVDSLRDDGPRPGTVLVGKYRLLAPIAEGGMGAVWRAEDLHLSSPVAVKLIHRRDAKNAEMLARFEAEAEIAAQLRSPHVVQVFDAGVDRETSMAFIAMELLDGESLRDRLASRGGVSPAALVDILTQVARALTRAHELGIVHRDLKPANVFLLHDGDREVVKVLDFGIAKRTNGHRAGPTVTGDLLGTPTYMSPEQIVSSKEVDYRTDLWSLGVIATECLTGKLPFDCDNLPGLALLICHGQSTPPSKLGPVPAGFDAWFQKATQLRPADRFATATAMVDELRKVCAGQREAAHDGPADRQEALAKRSDPVQPRTSPSVGPTTTTVPRQVGPLRRQRQRRVAALAAAAVLLMVVTCTVLRGGELGEILDSAPAGAQLQTPASRGLEAVAETLRGEERASAGAGGTTSLAQRMPGEAKETVGGAVEASSPPAEAKDTAGEGFRAISLSAKPAGKVIPPKPKRLESRPKPPPTTVASPADDASDLGI